MDIKSVAERIMDKAKLRSESPSPTEKSVAFDCEKCRDTGMVPVLETGEAITWSDSRLVGTVCTTQQCTCMVQKRLHRMFHSSGISGEFRKVGFRDFIVDGRPQCVKEARDTALDYYKRFDELRDEKGNSIVLVGPPGSGKTRLMMAVANGLMQRSVAVQYFPWVEGFNELKKDLDRIDEKARAMQTVDVLFIDDMFKGRTRPTEFMLEQLFGIVNFRYLNNKPLMVSSERSFDELFGLDEGLARRIYEMSRGHRVQMGLTDAEKVQGMELNYSLAGEAK